MKTKSRLFTRAKGFAPLLFLLIVLFTKPHAAMAQKAADTSKLLKYELSVDLVPIIDNGQFGKVLFKIRNKGNSGLKGAYRFGIQGSYNGYIYKDVDNQNQYLGNLNFTLGYEKYKSLAKHYFYYGIDLTTKTYFSKYDDTGWDELSGIAFSISPFVGFKYIINKRLSTSFEAAWENEIGFSKVLEKPEMTVKHNTSLISQFRVPYCLSINYQF